MVAVIIVAVVAGEGLSFFQHQPIRVGVVLEVGVVGVVVEAVVAASVALAVVASGGVALVATINQTITSQYNMICQ